MFFQESSILVYGYILFLFLMYLFGQLYPKYFLLTPHEIKLCVINAELLPRSNATMKKLFVFLVTELLRWARTPGGLIQRSPYILSCKATCQVLNVSEDEVSTISLTIH